MRIVVTGGDGFIGRNLRLYLRERGYESVQVIEQSSTDDELREALGAAEFVFHLAGVNRPKEVGEFDITNRGFTATLCEHLASTGRPIPVVYTSSTQALLDNPYGSSKRAGEEEIDRYAQRSGAPIYVFRLTNVFGKWSRPNYNSAVATFCHNIARGLPISINDPSSPLRLVYVDDVVSAMTSLLAGDKSPGLVAVEPEYETTVGEVAAMLEGFAASRESRRVPRAGTGFVRALYATYLSYLSPESFTYPLTRHVDPRGAFAEMLRTDDSGQVSFFTANPGVTRGGHYHHTKNEKFLVVRGQARFGFRHMVTGETYELLVTDEQCRVVETVPGWAHDVTNIGNDEMIVMLWANETFDVERPDTTSAPVLG